jgi:SAM-dependent methyltransferase
VRAAAERWGAALHEWAIPERILTRAPESPYGYPTECFRTRAERSMDRDPTPTTLRALEALPAAGTVLDVGVGGGATSLPLARKASRITGVDASQDMLDAFRQTAAAIGVEADTILGAWPDVARDAPTADVVVCGHVLYNVQDLTPFVLAMTHHARRRVVVEITDRHPWSWMNDLWRRFHDLGRPEGPTAEDAQEALRELGLETGRDDRSVPAGAQPPAGFERVTDAVALVRRRLCLPADRDPEIRTALGDRLVERHGLWSAGPAEQTLVTLWWDPER